MLVDLVVQRCQLGEPLAEHLRLRDRGSAELPLRRVPRSHLDERRAASAPVSAASDPAAGSRRLRSCFVQEAPDAEVMQAGHACIVSAPGARGLGEREPSPDGFYSRRVGLHAFLCEGSLQIGDQAARGNERRPRPGQRGGRGRAWRAEAPAQPRPSLAGRAEAGPVARPDALQDEDSSTSRRGSAAVSSPNCSRSRVRHREILLAIVPEGRSSASPIVR